MEIMSNIKAKYREQLHVVITILDKRDRVIVEFKEFVRVR